jgi:hypothetical protein
VQLPAAACGVRGESRRARVRTLVAIASTPLLLALVAGSSAQAARNVGLTVVRPTASAVSPASWNRARCAEKWNGTAGVLSRGTVALLVADSAMRGMHVRARIAWRAISNRPNDGRCVLLAYYRSKDETLAFAYIPGRSSYAELPTIPGAGTFVANVAVNTDGSLVASTPTTVSPESVMMPSYGGAAYESPHPKIFVIGNTSFAGFVWVGWGSKKAVGHGQVESNDCTPNCAKGHVSWRDTTITVSILVVCNGRHYYQRLELPGGEMHSLDPRRCWYV